MAVAYNPQIVTNGLVLALDVSSQRCISPLGCTGFNNAPQLLKNLVSTSDTINSYNGVKLGNLSYYTAFAIDYPEGSFGGSAAGRDGITPGYNVTSGTKTFDFGRALNYAVYNNPTQTWVKTTTYDSYLGTAAVDTFVSEYATAVATYPDAIHIVSGSHRDSFHTTAQYAILRDLGAPSNVDSIIGFSSPEWILVGKPGLGAGNAYGWAFENYSTDPTRVAHLNFGLPIYGTKDNYLEFDGTDDYVDCGTPPIGTGKITVNAWVKINAGSLLQHIVDSASNAWHLAVLTDNRPYFWNGSTYHTAAPPLTVGQWYMLTGVQGTTLDIYINGVLGQSIASNVNVSTNNVNIGRWQSGSRPLNGNISQVQIYNRALTAAEIKQNFNATRGRFGI